MSQNSQDRPEKNEASPLGDNIGKIKQSKQVKKESEDSKKLSEISAPKRRKILHKLMSKYHNDPFYKPIDIAKKVLKKLRVSNTHYFMSRIRQDMDRWIAENDPDSDSDEDNTDSKKNMFKDIRKKKQDITTVTNVGEDATQKPSNSEAAIHQAEPSEATNQLESNAKTGKTIEQEAVGFEKNVIPVIDLTVDIKEEIKEEVITIEDDSEASDTKTSGDKNTNATGGLAVLPYPIFGYDPMSFYYPEGFYQPYYADYYRDPNVQMYNPYMLPYGYLYKPYSYNQENNSDILPQYPIDQIIAEDP